MQTSGKSEWDRNHVASSALDWPSSLLRLYRTTETILYCIYSRWLKLTPNVQAYNYSHHNNYGSKWLEPQSGPRNPVVGSVGILIIPIAIQRPSVPLKHGTALQQEASTLAVAAAIHL